ncbi:hypothetical protein [Promicromonospora panici]|uniref:hypothetical protein n=1 Tax=Promicromonospora panici TaxID=2219658 RepID=UPI00101E103A|nr:hypothetical protein [Promicromonospora panici]
MVEDDKLAQMAAAIGRLGLVVVVVVVLLAGVAGTLYGVANLVAWAAVLPDGGRPVPARAVLVGVASAGVTWLCYRVVRRLGDDEDDTRNG